MSQMTESDRRELVSRIHTSDTRLVVTVAGGSMALADLQTAPGASHTLLEGLAPYSAGALRNLIATEPLPHVSEHGATALAEACLARATDYATDYEDEFPVIGVSCTAALATQRQRHGADRAWMAIAATGTSTVTRLVEFPADGVSSAGGAGADSAIEHAETFYARRITQERELADALLLFIAEHIN